MLGKMFNSLCIKMNDVQREKRFCAASTLLILIHTGYVDVELPLTNEEHFPTSVESWFLSLPLFRPQKAAHLDPHRIS